MKKIILLLNSFLVFNIFLFAHPPSEINIEFNLKNKEVKVIINHNVKNTTDHYIERITLLLNDKKIIEQISSVQIDNARQIYIYIIPELKHKDKITISAKCNKFGTLKKDFVVKNEEESEQWNLL